MTEVQKCGIDGKHDDSDIRLAPSRPASADADAMPQAWQIAFRNGIVPQANLAGLRSLRDALRRSDARLISGSTMQPPPLQCNEPEPVQACCSLAWLILDGRKPHEVSVGQLEERFAAACWRARELLGEPAGIRHFLNAVDEWTREQMFANLLPEVERAIAEKERQELHGRVRALAAAIEKVLATASAGDALQALAIVRAELRHPSTKGATP